MITIRRQAIAHRKIMPPTTISEVLGGLFCYPTAGGTLLGKHHRETPSPGQAAIVATRTRGGARSCDEAGPLELGQAASWQPTTTYPRLTTWVQPGRALHCSSQEKVPPPNSPQTPALLVCGRETLQHSG